jgi:GT2 family glycosyltransferase
LHVTAVVVTYNRRALLRECLAALAAQTRPVDRVLVVDNASTDGHARDGAGPTSRGSISSSSRRTRAAPAASTRASPAPTPTARTASGSWTTTRSPGRTRSRSCSWVADRRPEALVLASKVVWDDGSIHPMNAPGFERNRVDRLVDGIEDGLIPLRCATFVSLLVDRRAVDRYGLPHKQYFIWSDDVEYTARILRDDEEGFLVPRSVAHHRTKSAYTAVSTTGGRFYFHIRNHIFMLRGDAWDWREKLTLIYVMLVSTWLYQRANRFAAFNLRVVLRALRDGVRAPLPA